MGSKSGGDSQITGYRYYMDIVMGIARGPLNELVEIRVGDLKAWRFDEDVGAPVTGNADLTINKPDLFGGDEKEGGIKGNFSLFMGAATQIVSDFIKSKMNGPMGDWRGVATLGYYGLISTNNPYPKAWKVRVRRTTAGWEDDDPWYPEKANILLGQPNVAELTVNLNPVPGDFITINGAAIHFGSEVTIGGDAAATAAALITYINANTDDLSFATASGSGNMVEIAGPVDSPPLVVSQVGSIQISTSGGDIVAMNGAHIIYQAATDTAWGRGLPRSRLDDDAFRKAADALYAENFGLCFKWNRQDGLDKFVQSVLNHIGGVVNIDRTTGLLRLDLIRDDYDQSDIPFFDFTSGLLDITEDDSVSSDSLFNEIIVSYRDPITDQDGQVRAQNLASFQALGEIFSTTADYPGLPTGELASRIAQRDLELNSSVLRRFKVVLDRAGWTVRPGSVFRIGAESRGISEIVLRASDVSDSPLTDGRITVTAVQDVFTLPETAYLATEPSGWIPPDRTPHIAEVRRVEEITYRDLVRGLSPADLATVAPDAAAIKVFAVQPTGLSTDYRIATAAGSESLVRRGLNGWEPTALLSVSIGDYDTDIVFIRPSNMDFVQVGSALLIDDEYVRLDDLDVDAGTATIARGVMDTIPAPHASGARLWFEDAFPGGDGREYSSGETIHVQILTRTSSTTLDDGPIDDIVLGGRQGRPYPPGNVKANSIGFGVDGGGPTVGDPDITITWAHRDRVGEADTLLEHGAASTGPEAGTTYSVRVYDGLTLLHTITGISGTSYTYDAATATADGDPDPVTFELESVRDGYVSWQHYHFDVARAAGYGDDYNFNYNGGI